jgi:hypothetical protein
MPRVVQKADLSLKYLSLVSIGNFIDKIWCQHFIKYMFGQSYWRYIIGPFDSIPPGLTHDIFLHLKERKLLRKHHIFLLISPYAKQLDFSGCITELSLMLQLAGHRAIRANSLDLSGTKIPKNILSETLSTSLKTVSHLNLSRTNIGDDVVSLVGCYMDKMNHLDISYTAVSDNGLMTLFSPVDLAGCRNDRFGKCVNISKLMVASCQKISEIGALEALKCLKNLQVFDYQNSVGVISTFADEAKYHNKPRQKFLLKSLYVCTDFLPSDALSVAIMSCPQAEYIYLVTFTGMDENTALALLDMNIITEMHIRNEMDAFCLPFYTSCSPVLAKHGETMVSINLAEIEEVSVHLIRDACPNLLHLSLLWNRSFFLHDGPSSRSRFSRLRTVHVSCVDEADDGKITDIPSDDLVSILSCPDICSITLNNCQSLTDDVVRMATDVNRFDKIVKMELEKCDSVTIEGLEEILEAHNGLEQLALEKCENVTKRDVEVYRKKVKKLNWNIKVTWS